ncbi:MAG: hypothetical protein FJ294_13530 [Planctomycetes bacterium]|nr:hypothetical protein [Planctomycetota bacterium]MBM3988966.1 hypothetical protein [Planctomycetota bacterium]
MKVSGSKQTADVPSRQAMGEPEIIDLLRTNAGATCADIQRLKTAEDPKELARYLVEAQRRPAQTRTAISMTMFLFGILQ